MVPGATMTASAAACHTYQPLSEMNWGFNRTGKALSATRHCSVTDSHFSGPLPWSPGVYS